MLARKAGRVGSKCLKKQGRRNILTVGYRKQGFGAGSQSVVRAADRKPGKCRNFRCRPPGRRSVSSPASRPLRIPNQPFSSPDGRSTRWPAITSLSGAGIRNVTGANARGIHRKCTYRYGFESSRGRIFSRSPLNRGLAEAPAARTSAWERGRAVSPVPQFVTSEMPSTFMPICRAAIVS